MTKTDRETVKGFSKSSAAVRVSFLFQLCYAPLEEQEKLRGKSLPVPAAAAAAAAAGEAAAALVIKPGVPLVISGGWQGSEVIMSERFNYSTIMTGYSLLSFGFVDWSFHSIAVSFGDLLTLKINLLANR
jgi:hypothetical protein